MVSHVVTCSACLMNVVCFVQNFPLESVYIMNIVTFVIYGVILQCTFYFHIVRVNQTYFIFFLHYVYDVRIFTILYKMYF